MKRKSPRFVRAELLLNGDVRLIDDDGEKYHVELRRDQAWPMISRSFREFELREASERHLKRVSVPPTPPRIPPRPPGPRLIFSDAS